MNTDLACGVVGAGVFGGYHAQQYATLPGARLAGVFDPDPARARALAERLGVRAFDDLHGLLSVVQAVSVATPAHTHAALARAALDAGVHVYVEKPIAVTLEDAERLVEIAAKSRLTLAVGHQERRQFEAMGLFGVQERPLRLEAVRVGLPSARNRDVSCVLDLMIHDLDLAIALAGSEPLAVEASVHAREDGVIDAVDAEVAFSGGLIAQFTTSRVADARDRRMRLTYAAGVLDIDFLAKTFTNGTPFELDPGFAASKAGADPLRASLVAFIEGIGSPAAGADPLAGARQAVAALDLALAVEQACDV